MINTRRERKRDDQFDHDESVIPTSDPQTIPNHAILDPARPPSPPPLRPLPLRPLPLCINGSKTVHADVYPQK